MFPCEYCKVFKNNFVAASEQPLKLVLRMYPDMHTPSFVNYALNVLVSALCTRQQFSVLRVTKSHIPIQSYFSSFQNLSALQTETAIVTPGGGLHKLFFTQFYSSVRVYKYNYNFCKVLTRILFIQRKLDCLFRGNIYSFVYLISLLRNYLYGKIYSEQKQSSADGIQTSCSSKFCKAHRETPVMEWFFDKGTGFPIANQFLLIFRNFKEKRCIQNPVEYLRWSLFTKIVNG